MYVPDPVELLELQMEREMDRVDADGTYPCALCGRRFKPETMVPLSASPAASLACDRPDCDRTE